jgi:hypothetical protein
MKKPKTPDHIKRIKNFSQSKRYFPDQISFIPEFLVGFSEHRIIFDRTQFQELNAMRKILDCSRLKIDGLNFLPVHSNSPEPDIEGIFLNHIASHNPAEHRTARITLPSFLSKISKTEKKAYIGFSQDSKLELVLNKTDRPCQWFNIQLLKDFCDKKPYYFHFPKNPLKPLIIAEEKSFQESQFYAVIMPLNLGNDSKTDKTCEIIRDFKK